MTGAVWGEVANAALQVGAQWMNSDSQRLANRTNVKLQREQQTWEQMMSNTAVQRRADDIAKAGGNRALAFTNGSEASTPSITPARVDPVQFAPIRTNFTAAMLADAEIKAKKAETLDTLASARSKTVQANIDEKTAGLKTNYTANHYIEGYEWDDLKTEIMRGQSKNTAIENKRLEGTVDSIIQKARQDARTGQLDLAAYEHIAKMGGIEAGAISNFLRPIIQLLMRRK